MVVVRLAANTSSSVGVLSGNGRGDGKDNSGNPHFDMLDGYIVATVIVLIMYNEGQYRSSVSCDMRVSSFLWFKCLYSSPHACGSTVAR